MRKVWSPLFEERVQIELGVDQLASIVELLREKDEFEPSPTWHSWIADQLEGSKGSGS